MSPRAASAKKIAVILIAAALLFPGYRQVSAAVKLAPPEQGVYHAAHPDFGMTSDLVSAESVRRFESLAGRRLVWSYFSWHWKDGIIFPSGQCRALNGAGVVPLIGIMPWSTLRQGESEPVYTLDRISRGDFDRELAACAEEVRGLGFPVMMEFGPEVNGSWFPWNGAWNGRDAGGETGLPGGPERFRDAFRRVVEIFRRNGAEDVTWVFHIAAAAAPPEPWNSAANYYPGDDCVDWIGVSVYGMPDKNGAIRPFDEIIKHVYPGMCAISDAKPLAVLELGAPECHAKAGWITDALGSINSGRYPRIKAVAWWNRIQKSDGSPSRLEIDSSPGSLSAYRAGVGSFVEEAVWVDIK